jgi:hypothetical protein
MAKKVTLKIPRRKRRYRTYLLAAAVCATGFAIVYSLFTGQFRSSPGKIGSVRALDGPIEVFHGGETLKAKAGADLDLFPDDSIVLDGQRAQILFTDGDRFSLRGKGTFSLREAAGERIELTLSGVALEGYFEKPNRRVKCGFIELFPRPSSSLAVEPAKGVIVVRSQRNGCDISLPNGGTIHMDDGGAGGEEGYQKVRIEYNADLEIVRVDARLRNRSKGIALGVRGKPAVATIYHAGSATVTPGGILEIISPGERIPVEVKVPEGRPEKPPAPSDAPRTPSEAPGEKPGDGPEEGTGESTEAPPGDETAEPKTPPSPPEKPGPADTVEKPSPKKAAPPPPAEGPGETVEKPEAETEVRGAGSEPDATPSPETAPPSPETAPPAPGKEGPGVSPPPSRPPDAGEKPTKGEAVSEKPVKKPAPVKPRKGVGEPARPKGKGETKPRKPSPRKAVKRPPAPPPPPPLAPYEMMVLGQSGRVVVRRDGIVSIVGSGRFRVRPGDILRVRAGGVARLRVGRAIVTLYEHTEYRVP